MLAVAIKEAFRTALTGRCDARPDLAAARIPLTVRIPALRCRGSRDGSTLAHRVFAPLGWRVDARPQPFQPAQWGDSPYLDLRLTGELRLADALNHLYVLLPALDDAKHYWVSTEEVDKLIRAGGDWLAGHPEKDLITRRYLSHQRKLTRSALARLAEADDTDPAELDNAVTEDDDDKDKPLAVQRREAILSIIREIGARRVGDLGCGAGVLTRDLLADSQIEHVTAVDVSARALQLAARHLKLDQMPEAKRSRLTIFQSSLTYRDDRLAGLDAAVLMEVIEHLDPERIPALERATFGFAAPATVVVTTPNAEYNAHFETLPAGALRHRDHRFEWTRAEFRAWAGGGGQEPRLPGPLPARRAGAPAGRAAHPAGRLHQGGGMTELSTAGLGIPELSLVVLIGVTGSGKSTFARAHFKPTEVISSDFCRGLVADDENDQSATPAAFELLHHIAGVRLAAGRLTVIDATNVQPEARRELVTLAREHDVLPVAIVLDLPEKLCAERNADRPDRDFGAHVLRRQRGQLRRGLHNLRREGFRTVHVLRTPEEVDAVTITRTRLFSDLRHEAGPFDVIGDVHGCRAELEELLVTLGYELERDAAGRPAGARHPARRAVFVGDLVDRGPDTPGVLRLVMGMVAAGTAFCVAGNHEVKLAKALRGKNVKRSHGLDASMEQLDLETEEFRAEAARFIDGLISHYVLDGGRLVVAHAGLVERYHGRASGRVREFCLYGQTTGETDEYGLPVRYPWATEYRGRAAVLYGHTPVPAAEWLNNTLCVDTGCVFGGRLTALNYPERTTVSVQAARVYHPPARPFPGVAAPGTGSVMTGREPGVLDIGDVSGSRVIETAYLPRVGVRDAHAAAALEVMSRFAIDPRWLLYLPPTMSPVATSARDDLLEHPDQAFGAYRADGVASVLCEEKHMGSRAVLLVCRTPDDARSRFGMPGGGVSGTVWTRTGRPFFGAERATSLAAALVDQVRAAAEKAGLFDELGTSWLLLDAELVPWNAKAGQLIRDQYAATSAAALASLPAAVSALAQASARGLPDGGLPDGGLPGVGALLDRTRSRLANAEAFTAAYLRYCWATDGLAGVRVAPFQLLATEGAVYHERPHLWHLGLADRLAAGELAGAAGAAGQELIATTRRVYAETGDPASVAAATRWWEELTAAGGEGMVVKPAANLTRGAHGLVQPGLKVRGREYLRLIYGPDYTEPANLTRLRQRGLSHKRSLALREYALGLEALDRVARGEPLWRVHECVFAVLALESEPVDPRL